jgi:endonuclease/exonuclease/phosphatase family metal-dependent hydrolase
MINRFAFILILLVSLFISCDNNKSNDEPVEPDDGVDFSTCLTSESEDVLEVMTWNIEHFPIEGEETMKLVTQIIQEQSPDLIAFQEISNKTSFDDLDAALTDYDGQIYISGDINQGYFYKTSDITVIGNIQAISSGDSYAFPRAPVKISVRHKNGIETNLINVHLKCCGGIDNYLRRMDASEQLKQYIDTNLPDDKVIVLGDFNDEIYGIPDDENPFLNFLNDTENYEFADMALAQSDKSDWSYPNWPSHIDHILITNELFDQASETVTVSYDGCYDEYFDMVSDHRPLIIKLTN